MKINLRAIAVAVLFLLIVTASLFSQERPMFITATTMHVKSGMDDAKWDEWKSVEKTYFDKVIMKNDFIMTATVLTHYFTADNSEVIFVAGYSSWENIEKAFDRNNELEKEAWPDKANRDAFMKKQEAFYTGVHSDEIYSTVEGAKLPTEKSDEPMVYYIRKSHMARPEGASNEEIQALAKEFDENVIYKNKYIKAYYPSRHAWGSDSQDFIQAFAVNSLCDIENALNENQKLIEAHWPDEAKRKAFFKKFSSYSTGWHGDYIYHDVPELSKGMVKK